MTQKTVNDIRQSKSNEAIKEVTETVADIVNDIKSESLIRARRFKVSNEESESDRIEVFLGEREEIENYEYVEADIITEVLKRAPVRLSKTGSSDGEYSALMFEVVFDNAQ
jgi:hypothetical protein